MGNTQTKGKLLIIGGSSGAKDYIRYCREIGVHTIVTDWHTPEVSKTKKLSDEYWMISALDMDALEQKCREEGVTGVISGANEMFLDVAMELSRRLGLRFYTTPEAWVYPRNKKMFKEMCIKHGLSIAPDYTPLLAEPEKIPLPALIKPTDSNANRGQTVCRKREDILPAIEYALSFSEKKQVIAEKFLEGEELFVTYTMRNGEVALSLLCGVYVNEGQPKHCYSVTCNRSVHLKAYMEKVNQKVIAMLKDMGCINGMAAISCIAADGDFYFLEMAHRLPGGMIQVGYREISGVDYAKIFADYVLFGDTDCPIVEQTEDYEKIACSYFIWSREGVIARQAGVDTLEKKGYTVVPYHEPGDRLGGELLVASTAYLVCFSADNDDDFLRKMEEINSTLVCEDENGRDLLVRFNNYACIPKRQ